MSKFLDLINKQRQEKKEEKFEGTFLEYLEKVQNDPDIAKPAHKRMYDAIKNKGVNVLDCLLYTSPSPRDLRASRMPSSA